VHEVKSNLFDIVKTLQSTIIKSSLPRCSSPNPPYGASSTGADQVPLGKESAVLVNSPREGLSIKEIFIA